MEEKGAFRADNRPAWPNPRCMEPLSLYELHDYQKTSAHQDPLFASMGKEQNRPCKRSSEAKNKPNGFRGTCSKHNPARLSGRELFSSLPMVTVTDLMGSATKGTQQGGKRTKDTWSLSWGTKRAEEPKTGNHLYFTNFFFQLRGFHAK